MLYKKRQGKSSPLSQIITGLILSAGLFGTQAGAQTATYCTGTFATTSLYSNATGGQGTVQWYNPINGYTKLISQGAVGYNSGKGFDATYNADAPNAVAQDPATSYIYYFDRSYINGVSYDPTVGAFYLSTKNYMYKLPMNSEAATQIAKGASLSDLGACEGQSHYSKRG